MLPCLLHSVSDLSVWDCVMSSVLFKINDNPMELSFVRSTKFTQTFSLSFYLDLLSRCTQSFILSLNRYINTAGNWNNTENIPTEAMAIELAIKIYQHIVPTHTHTRENSWEIVWMTEQRREKWRAVMNGQEWKKNARR